MRYEDIGKMPDTRSPKWGEMKSSRPRMSEEWVDMESSDAKMSEKWVDQNPSTPRMSEKWVDQEASNARMSEEWVEMEQKRRRDPYAMVPSSGDREVPFKPMKKEKADGGKVERASQHTEFGTTREI